MFLKTVSISTISNSVQVQSNKTSEPAPVSKRVSRRINQLCSPNLLSSSRQMFLRCCLTTLLPRSDTSQHYTTTFTLDFTLASRVAFRPFWGIIEIQKCMELGKRCQGTIAARNHTFPIWAVCH